MNYNLWILIESVLLLLLLYFIKISNLMRKLDLKNEFHAIRQLSELKKLLINTQR